MVLYGCGRCGFVPRGTLDSIVNRILLRQKELDSKSNCCFAAEDRRARHLVSVLRAKPGQAFEAGILHTKISGQFWVTDLAKNGSVRGHFCGQQDNIQKRHNLSIVLGLPRPPVLKRLLQDLSSAGVREIVLIQADLCEGAYRKSHVWDQLEHYLILGAEQGRINRLPKIICRNRQGLGLSEYLFELDETRRVRNIGSNNCIVLDREGTPRRVAVRPEGAKNHYIVAIGPERGWTPSEMIAFEEHKFQRYSLGRCTFRTEVAAHLALGLYILENI